MFLITELKLGHKEGQSMNQLSAYNLIIAYVASILGGQLLLAPLMELARSMLGNPTKRIWWVSFVVGMTERAVATTLVVWTPKLLALFIGGWTVAKIAGGWGRIEKGTPPIRAAHMIALVGTVLSFAVAIAAGLWAHPASLAALADARNSD